MVTMLQQRMFEKIVRNISSINKDKYYDSISSSMYENTLPVFHQHGLWKCLSFNTPWYDILLKGPGGYIIKNLIPPDITDQFYYPESVVKSKYFKEYFKDTYIKEIGKSWLGSDFIVESNLIKKYNPEYCCNFNFMPFQHTPSHLKYINQFLTLDMYIFHNNVDTSNFKILPYSHLLKERYTQYKKEEFKDIFDEYSIDIKLSKGDAFIMNPSLVHKFTPNSKNLYNYVEFKIQLSQ